MKIKTSELEGAALDYFTAVATGSVVGLPHDVKTISLWLSGELAFKPSTNWAQGGPLIELRRIDLIYEAPKLWHSELCQYDGLTVEPYSGHCGPTPLIAAMRAIVASEVGDEVDVPEELL